MSAIITDQFRILNANNFVESVENANNSYYITVGLPNPAAAVGYGRVTNWDSNVPSPTDNFDYVSHTVDTTLFGKKVSSANCRRLIRRVDWTRGTRYEMYRHDYSVDNQSPVTSSTRLYDANYYVMNSDYRVYICISNGTSGINTTGTASQDEPLFTDLEPSKAGESGDGYIWKYLFTVAPSDIIKFDSTEFISVPNDWDTSTDSQIQAVRENGDSSVNENQIKKVYIEDPGLSYSGGEVDIVGDGTGAKCVVTVDSNGKITDAVVSSGGKNYTYAMVDLGPLQPSGSIPNPAKLIPIIPPGKGHGNNIYKELGTDRVLLYARFDDSNKDFPTNTSFAQIGVIKNPLRVNSTAIFDGNQFSATSAIKLKLDGTISGEEYLTVGKKITQSVTTGAGVSVTAEGYVASYDSETKVIKYFQDRTLNYHPSEYDQRDYVGVSSEGQRYAFAFDGSAITTADGFSGSVDSGYTGITTNPTGNKNINLGVEFTKGLAVSEINKLSGDVIYLDNRPVVERNARQKEDVKIILEF
jgi:hypothetical protein